MTLTTRLFVNYGVIDSRKAATKEHLRIQWKRLLRKLIIVLLFLFVGLVHRVRLMFIYVIRVRRTLLSARVPAIWWPIVPRLCQLVRAIRISRIFSMNLVYGQQVTVLATRLAVIQLKQWRCIRMNRATVFSRFVIRVPVSRLTVRIRTGCPLCKGPLQIL